MRRNSGVLIGLIALIVLTVLMAVAQGCKPICTTGGKEQVETPAAPAETTQTPTPGEKTEKPAADKEKRTKYLIGDVCASSTAFGYNGVSYEAANLFGAGDRLCWMSQGQTVGAELNFQFDTPRPAKAIWIRNGMYHPGDPIAMRVKKIDVFADDNTVATVILQDSNEWRCYPVRIPPAYRIDFVVVSAYELYSKGGIPYTLPSVALSKVRFEAADI